MTRTLFCLSMPGGHMSYIATLASLLLDRIPMDYGYITIKGSSHGADSYFPLDFDSLRVENYRPAEPTDTEYYAWHNTALDRFSKDGLCVIKEGWHKYGADMWSRRLVELDNISIISKMDDLTNLYYCWFNAVDKIPGHVYARLREKSKLWPALWWKVDQKIRIRELSLAMPLYSLTPGPQTDKPCLRINAIDVNKDDFPVLVNDFLIQQGQKSTITDDILEYHKHFASLQQRNLNKAIALASNQKWKPTGKFEQILFDWYDRTLNENIAAGRLKYLNNRSGYLR